MTNHNIDQKEDMSIVIVGHVDHGKSTVIGRLMADTNALPEGKLEQVKETCRRNSKPFEYAFLLDALKDEQAQGITIDAARCFFKTDKRDYIILDAPGHIEFLKNMVTGASRAEAALLVIDAHEGVQENSTRHGYLLSMLGIKQISVLVNKMDLVDYSEEVFNNIVEEYSQFLEKIEIEPTSFIPISGFYGDNVASNASDNMPWYTGKNVLEQLDDFKNAKVSEDKPFRMPIQGVYKFTNQGDSRRIIAGTIDTGKISVGDEIVFYPSGKKTKVKSLEIFNAEEPESLSAGYTCGFTMTDQIYVNRGEIATKAGELKPQSTTKVKANLFWLGKEPLTINKRYFLKLGTAKVGVTLDKIVRVLDASNLNNDTKDQVERHEVAEVILELDRAIAFDLAKDITTTSRFVIIDNYEIAGGGIIDEALEDQQSWIRDKVQLRNIKWEKSEIPWERRAERYSQKPSLVLITGPKDVNKKILAKALEKKLFEEGKHVYYLGISNVLYGVDADIKKENSQENREEQLRRLGEVVNLMLDSGIIVIVTATNINQDELELIQTTLESKKIETIWLGANVTTDLRYNMHIESVNEPNNVVNIIKTKLQSEKIIFTPFS